MAMVGLNFKLTTAASLRDILVRGTFCWRASDRGGGCQKRRGLRYLSGRSPDWIKIKNPNSPAVKREAEKDWGR